MPRTLELPPVPQVMLSAPLRQRSALTAHCAARRSWLRRLYERLLTRLTHLIVAFQSPR